jgi:hypothetical protein
MEYPEVLLYCRHLRGYFIDAYFQITELLRLEILAAKGFVCL